MRQLVHRVGLAVAGLPNAAERFYAAGEERAKMSLPPGHGYPVAKDDRGS